MNWNLEFLPKVEKDLKQLSGDQRILVRKAIKKVKTNPEYEMQNSFSHKSSCGYLQILLYF